MLLGLPSSFVYLSKVLKCNICCLDFLFILSRFLFSFTMCFSKFLVFLSFLDFIFVLHVITCNCYFFCET